MTDALLARLPHGDRDHQEAARVIREQIIRWNENVLETYFVMEDYPAQKARADAAEAEVARLNAVISDNAARVAAADEDLTIVYMAAVERGRDLGRAERDAKDAKIATARNDALGAALAIIRKASWPVSGDIDLTGEEANAEIIQPILALIDQPAPDAQPTTPADPVRVVARSARVPS